MTTIAAARVDVLTAEVRVLVVGSRQITLSVYGQLDYAVSDDGLVPFGRVRPGRAHCLDPWGGGRLSPECPGDCTDVVGRDADGVLVRSCTGSGRRNPRWEALPLIVLAGLR